MQIYIYIFAKLCKIYTFIKFIYNAALNASNNEQQNSFYFMAVHHSASIKIDLKKHIKMNFNLVPSRAEKVITFAVRETSVCQHNGGHLRVPLKPLNTIECCDNGLRGVSDAERRVSLQLKKLNFNLG